MTPNDDRAFEALTASIAARHDELPPQLKKIARFVIDHPHRVALMTIADLASEAGVQPSAVIRFSKALGYSGYTELQRILRDALSIQFSASYRSRLQSGGGGTPRSRAVSLARASLDTLPTDEEIGRAAEVLAGARLVHVVGMRRAFGVASYLAYNLSQFGAPVNHLTGVGAMPDVSASSLSGEDAMVAISFPEYRTETIDMASRAVEAGCPIVAITDSMVSPLARLADVVLLTDRETDGGFRSIAGSVVTAQALALEFGHRTRS